MSDLDVVVNAVAWKGKDGGGASFFSNSIFSYKPHMETGTSDKPVAITFVEVLTIAGICPIPSIHTSTEEEKLYCYHDLRLYRELFHGLDTRWLEYLPLIMRQGRGPSIRK